MFIDPLTKLSPEAYTQLVLACAEIGVQTVHDSYNISIENLRAIRNILPDGELKGAIKMILFSTEYGYRPNKCEHMLDRGK